MDVVEELEIIHESSDEEDDDENKDAINFPTSLNKHVLVEKDVVEEMEILHESDDEKDDEGKKEINFPVDQKYGQIKNKIIRNAKYQKDKRQIKKDKREARKKRQKEGGPRQVPHTIESLRLKDETSVGDLAADDNELVRDELDCDEFSSYFKEEYEPKILITYADNPLRKTRIFGKELTRVIPNSMSRFRNRSSVKKIVKSSIREGFTDVLIVNENRRQPNGLLVIHLPDGPTAHFKLSNVKITSELRKNHKDITEHKPEVILNNFTTRLGLTIGRMFGSLFNHRPDFEGKRAVTFHNQRDYIFFRHYRYNFDSEGKRTRLKELGPRFTLKLMSLQKGTFNSKAGNYEWIIAGKRHDVQSSRRKFFL